MKTVKLIESKELNGVVRFDVEVWDDIGLSTLPEFSETFYSKQQGMDAFDIVKEKIKTGDYGETLLREENI